MHLHGREAAGELVYERHRPEDTRLYRLVEQHYPEFVAHLAEQGKDLPAYVEKEFEAHLECGWLEHDFLRVRCKPCHFERLIAFSCKKRGFYPSCGARRMAETAALLADGALSFLYLNRCWPDRSVLHLTETSRIPLWDRDWILLRPLKTAFGQMSSVFAGTAAS